MALDLMPAVPMLAVAVSIFLALAYLLSRALQNEQLALWVKIELAELIVSAVLIAIITGMFASAPQILRDYTGEAGDFREITLAVVDGWIDGFYASYKGLVKLSNFIGQMSSLTFGVSIPVYVFTFGFGGSTYGGVSILLGMLSRLSTSLTTLVFLYEGLRALLEFIFITVPPILLPLSFMARLIPFLRKTGSALIALSITAYLLLPFAIIFTNALNEALGEEKPEAVENVSSPFYSLSAASVMKGVVCSEVGRVPIDTIRGLRNMGEQLFGFISCIWAIPFGWFPGCYATVTLSIYPFLNIAFDLFMSALFLAFVMEYVFESAAAAAGGGGSAPTVIFESAQYYATETTKLIVLGNVNLVLIALIVLVGARSISTALGGDWYMAGIQRLI